MGIVILDFSKINGSSPMTKYSYMGIAIMDAHKSIYVVSKGMDIKIIKKWQVGKMISDHKKRYSLRDALEYKNRLGG